MTFRVGQRVVCVDDSFVNCCVVAGTILPRKGEVYTVRDLFRFSKWIAVRVDEIRNDPVGYLNEDNASLTEAAFPDFRFRPLVERKTDISIFTKMLGPRKRSKITEQV